MDQGWRDIINGKGVEHLIDNSPLFTVENDKIVIFRGEGLWINHLDLQKLDIQ